MDSNKKIQAEFERELKKLLRKYKLRMDAVLAVQGDGENITQIVPEIMIEDDRLSYAVEIDKNKYN